MRANGWMWAILMAAATTASGRELYVNNIEGDDRHNGYGAAIGGRGNGPIRSIGVALRRAQSGDHIIIANTGEPYRESLTLQAARNSGVSELEPFVIEGNGALIDGSILIDESGWEAIGGDVFRFSPEIKSTQVLFLDGKPASRLAVERGAEHLPKMEPLQWCLWNGDLYFRAEPGNIPQFYNPSLAGSLTGITIYDVRDVVIRDLQVRGFALDGLNAHDNAFYVRMEGVKSTDNGRSGISIGGASRVSLLECRGAGNFTAQLRTEGYCETQIESCQFDPATAPAIERAGGRIIEKTAE